MGKRGQMFGVFVIWGALLIIFGFGGSAVGLDWLMFIPIVGALIHAFLISSSK